MRPRLRRGTFVGSTDKFKAIKAKRMIIEVLYNFKTGVVKEKVVNVRETLEQ
jgi:hypothetical protein